MVGSPTHKHGKTIVLSLMNMATSYFKIVVITVTTFPMFLSLFLVLHFSIGEDEAEGGHLGKDMF